MIRNRSDGFGLPVCAVQKVAMASLPAVDWSDNKESQALVARLADGDEHALARLYDGTNRVGYGLALRILSALRVKCLLRKDRCQQHL
jgi:hypothetical protein